MVIDWWILGIWSVILFVGAVIGGFLAGLLTQWRVSLMETHIKNLHQRINSPAGVQARQDKQADLNLAVIRGQELHAKGMKPLEIAKTIGVEHPAVALDAIKKLMKLAKEMNST